MDDGWELVVGLSGASGRQFWGILGTVLGLVGASFGRLGGLVGRLLGLLGASWGLLVLVGHDDYLWIHGAQGGGLAGACLK